MGLFDFLKSKTETDLTPEQTIRRLVEYMPDFYTTDIHFKSCLEFLENSEWGLALDSLIELASDSGHYFSEDFWLGLADAANKMGVADTAKYCRQQINRNEKEIKSNTPFGWTTIKIDDTHFQHHISKKLKEEWATKRQKEDNVFGLVNQEGVHLKSHGRTGFFYFVDKGRIAEIEFELGMKGLITYFDSVEHWAIPTKTTMTKEEKEKLKQQLNAWSARTKNALDFT